MRRLLLLQTLIAVLSATANHLSQQPFVDGPSKNRVLNTQVDAVISSILEDFKSPGGVGVAVVQKLDQEESVWSVETKGYGIAKVDGTMVTEDTLFAIASNSKLFDVLATGLLISNESLSTRISWDTKIASIVPEWELLDPVASAESTIVDVMSHRTGIPRHDYIVSASDTIPDSIRRLRYLKPSTGFRELWQYNNHMYTLLSYLPQLLVGTPLETYVGTFILEPLGMSSTTYFSGQAEETGNLADGMGRDGANQTEDVFAQGTVRSLPMRGPNKGTPGHVYSGRGGVITNAKDMAVWLQMLLNEGRHPTSDKLVIPSEVVRRVATGVTVSVPVGQYPETGPVVYGGGQSRGTYRGFEYIEHGGSVTGFRSQIIRVPGRNLGIAVLSNDESFGTPIVETIKFTVLDKALGLETIDWNSRQRSLIAAEFHHRVKPTPRPHQAALPSFPFAELAGKYGDLGYGNTELCLVSLDDSELIQTPSESCRQLLKELPTTLPNIVNPRIPTFVTRWQRLGFTHLSFVHFDKNVFNVSFLASIPTRNASERPYWVREESGPDFVAEFASDGNLGFGLRGVWGPGQGVQSPRGDTVKERAEAWFTKINQDD